MSGDFRSRHAGSVGDWEILSGVERGLRGGRQGLAGVNDTAWLGESRARFRGVLAIQAQMKVSDN